MPASLTGGEKSDRLIGAEIGVSDRTVNRARQKSTATHDAVEKRIGRDGKRECGIDLDRCSRRPCHGRITDVSEKSTVRAVKVVAGTALVLGLIFTFIERLYAPNTLVTEDSTILPAWIGWFGLLLTAVASVVYVLVDILDWLHRRR